MSLRLWMDGSGKGEGGPGVSFGGGGGKGANVVKGKTGQGVKV